ncbi:lipopolysaccharide biosynthesis protein [Indibacter alkaliphilus LW1]|uniref:Lipopolysaccharide biosynthesis protein n=1 Tax=Indibacter alkaliphilus (strain CCUG 57479 / KCTC 22604 / LW1) TaxID=1189612 RepID=S2CXX8_INDAL|nr:exopolysaccharide biosynthesis protein [Indibacter alkaliphilus]EOZ92022.1 lipopolysaccharide biosynthesis protein [Indibacter alkaliphilus LW1]
MEEQKHIVDDKITLREVVLRFKFWLSYFIGQWKLLFLAGLIGLGLGALASVLKKPVYHAETTFVLEESDMSGLGQMSGLASLVGVNLGSLGSSSGLFQGDNIMELYRSDNMLGKTLLSPFDDQSLLIDRYISFQELDKKWKRKVDLTAMDFSKPRENFTVSQDSVLKEISKLIREKQLSVEKPNRKLTIIQVNVSSKDEKFAKVFNETLVDKVNSFYFETKTKKTAENLEILQSQADSVRKILDQSLAAFASSTDRVPNPNPLLQAATVDARKKQVDVQASTAVYTEIVKNLEIAKVNHRNNSPLIQIIDTPVLPLKRSEIKLVKGMVLGAIAVGFIALLFLYFGELYRIHVEEKQGQEI